jgi:hypothetical protein
VKATNAISGIMPITIYAYTPMKTQDVVALPTKRNACIVSI